MSMLESMFNQIDRELGIRVIQYAPLSLPATANRRYGAGDWTFETNEDLELTMKKWRGPTISKKSPALNVPSAELSPEGEQEFYQLLKRTVEELGEDD